MISLSFGEELADLSYASLPFAYCASLERVDLSRCPLEDIPEDCFLSSSSLMSVLLPDGLKTIEKHAFLGCKKLKSLVIPASMETKISYELFTNAYTSNHYITVQYYFYKGSEEQAKEIFPSDLESRVYFYSEEKPSEKGSYWHYVDGEPALYTWEEQA